MFKRKREVTHVMVEDTEKVNADAVAPRELTEFTPSTLEAAKNEIVSELTAILAPITEIVNDFGDLLSSLADNAESYAVRHTAREILERSNTASSDAPASVEPTDVSTS